MKKAKDDRRARFIKALAQYLAGDVARKSIALQIGTQEAHDWANLRAASPVSGYMTAAEAEQALEAFL